MLTKFKTPDTALTLLQTAWADKLDPIIDNPLSQGVLLPALSLRSGSNIINHKLGKELQGWLIVRQNASATFYDTQASNSLPGLTLTLVASAPVTVSLYVF